MAELRKDPVVERWVVIATERARRPSDFVVEVPATVDAAACAFCPGREERTPPELLRLGDPGPGGWTLRVVPNRFPALRVEGEVDASGEGIYDRMNGVGAHEVVIETPEHRASLGSMPRARVAGTLAAYRQRLVELKKDPRLAYALVFKNRGAAAGASIDHPHSQLIATPIVPELVTEELEAAARYFRRKDRCVWCDVVRQERRQGVRLVLEQAGFLALAPFAPRFPFETWILPIRHQPAFETLDDQDLDGLAGLLRALIGCYDGVLREPPYNFALHTAPLQTSGLAHFHWHIELMPKLIQVAGFEWGSGFFINPTPPEDAARFLREWDRARRAGPDDAPGPRPR